MKKIVKIVRSQKKYLWVKKDRIQTRFRGGFHGPTNRTDERHKTADLWNFENIFNRYHGFVKSAD